jgi:pimeloyl-ACP methyl ester carboxylesterase
MQDAITGMRPPASGVADESAGIVITRHNRNGLALRGTTFGPESGEPVLLFHGGGQTRHAWSRTGAALGAAGFRATAYDFRGHGDSDWSDRYDIDEFAADVFDMVKAEARKPVIVGASLGGLSALLANEGDAGEISRALVLVDVAPRLNPEGVDRILNFMAAHPEGFASLAEAAAAVAAYQPQRTQRADHQGLQKNLRQRDDGRWYWHWDPTMMNTFQQARRATHDEDIFYRAAEKLTQPILLVRGMMSDVVDDRIAREFQDRIPHARVVEVGQAGHMVAGDRNDVFREAVLEFLRNPAVTASR